MDSSSSITLSRLLTRLDQSLLSGEQDSRLRGSRYERQKATSNVEHARTLLLTLEKQCGTIKSPAQKQQTQADLQQKRELIKRLNARLQELNELGDAAEAEDDDDDDSDEDEEQTRSANYGPALKDTQDGLDSTTSSDPNTLLSQLPAALQQQNLQSQQQPPDLRSRRPLQALDNRSAATTTAREALFANRSSASSNPTTANNSNLSQSETLLSHNRVEQENLTTGLLGLAQALKQSSQQFSQSLADEKDVLKRAEGGLDKSAQGMEAAERKMGMLRQMSEGQGWWGRLKLYGFIFALWVGCFLIVFVGPKLKF